VSIRRINRYAPPTAEQEKENDMAISIVNDDEAVAWLLDRRPEAGDHEGKLTLADRQAWLDYVSSRGGVEHTVFAPQDAATLEQQAAAVERAAVNQRGHIDNLRSLLARKKRSLAELIQQAEWAPALEEAAVTLRSLANVRKNHAA
jgi:hypothetical protein